MPIPYKPDSVLSPRVVCGDSPIGIYYLTHDDEHVRVTFEGLDAVRVARGEYLPYPQPVDDDKWYSLWTIENSRWLRERHSYEANYYRDCYEFGGDVDEMLTDFDHYLLTFHDEFVEVIASGIWFEKAGEAFASDDLPPGHPSLDLPESATVRRFTAAGITCQIRANQRPLDEILSDSRYCSQPLYHFALELDGSASVNRRFDVRTRRGETRCYGRNWCGTITERAAGLPTLDEAQALVEPYVREVSQRRRDDPGEFRPRLKEV